VAIPLVLGLIHVGLVAPHYFVGSFDDDAGYILTAKTLLAGHGLTAQLPLGTSIAGLYPPGYSALLVPLVWLWPHSFVPLRLFSVIMYAALFPLTWTYMARRRIQPGLIFAALVVLALSPPLATFGSMVMAETLYLVILLVLLLLLDRWAQEARTWTGTGAATIIAAGALIWVKQAGLAFVAGLVLWLTLRHKRWGRGWAGFARAAALAGGVVVLLLPVIVARLATGMPIAGSRYSVELGSYYQGGLLSRVVHVLPSSTWHLISTAIPATVVPYLDPLPIEGHWPDLWKIVSWQVTILAAVGAVMWFRRYRDAAVIGVLVYFLQSVLWPYVNERRVILVLPLLGAWYVVGAHASWVFVRDRVVTRPFQLNATRGLACALVLGLVVMPWVGQLPRDYLLNLGQDTSQMEGSRYVQLLSQLGTPADVVETDYLSSTALFTGHKTGWKGYRASLNDICYGPAVVGALASDHAAYLLDGDFNKPGYPDNGCVQWLAAGSPWAVELLYTTHDNGIVYELIGPGTGNPDLTDLLSGVMPSIHDSGVTDVDEWDWGQVRQVTQVSVGDASFIDEAMQTIALQIEMPDGAWLTVASADSAVGDGPHHAPFLLAKLPAGTQARAMRLVAVGTSAGGGLSLDDVHALGPSR
jgi:hypothetical protein